MAKLLGTDRARPGQRTTQSVKAEPNRQQRLNKALRENLLKRKQQNRSRQQQQVIAEDSSTRKN